MNFRYCFKLLNFASVKIVPLIRISTVAIYVRCVKDSIITYYYHVSVTNSTQESINQSISSSIFPCFFSKCVPVSTIFDKLLPK